MPVVDASTSGAGASAGHAGAEATGASAAVPEAPANGLTLASEGWAARIQELKKQTSQLREDRQRVAKELKAAQRKNRRLKERARCLSEEDMLQILVMKRAKSAENASNPDAGVAGPSSGSSDASAFVPSAVLSDMGSARSESSPRAEGDLDDQR